MPRLAAPPLSALRRPIRRLPRPIPPFHRETTASYFLRLEIANGLPADRTGANLGINDASNHLTLLSQLTGRQQSALRFALPQLATSDPHGRPTLYGEPALIHRACEHCLVAAGVNGSVRRWVLHEEVVCLRHRRWLGSPEEEPEEQLDLGSHADILTASRCHRRLIARHGRTAVHAAYETSAKIVWDWQFQGRRLSSVSARLDRLRAGRRCTYMDAAVQAALYPAAVALTGLLASPTWRQLAFTTDDSQTRRFLHHVAETVTDGYYPAGGQDPLRHHLTTGSSDFQSRPAPEPVRRA